MTVYFLSLVPTVVVKTTFCKTTTQIQLLAQLGCKIPAQIAEISVADHIFYQTPEFSSRSDGEGRFGAELKRTKEIFVTSTASTPSMLY